MPEIIVCAIQLFLLIATLILYSLLRKTVLEVKNNIGCYLEVTGKVSKPIPVIDDDRYLQDMSKGGRKTPSPPKVDPEDKLHIIKGDDWGG